MPEHLRFDEAVKNYTAGFYRVVPYDPETDRLLRLDFTKSNTALNAEVVSNNTLFSDYIRYELEKEGARYGVGGYGEHRTIYSRSAVFGKGEEEPRRFHLGMDIWGPAGTEVYAPMEGTVHSFAYNGASGDYGATLILQHEIGHFLFHTLYGHLSIKSISDKKEGEDVERGQWIGAFGRPEENGEWPPHLHFQVIIDLEHNKGDYPGVCRYSGRERYLRNCPDPDLILGMLKRG